MQFSEYYQCYSSAFADKPGLEEGDKILLPSSALDILARLHVDDCPQGQYNIGNL